MFRNYFKIALRNVRKYKVFSIINILGMAIGMASVLLIGAYIMNELGYDTYHKNYRRIYRLMRSSRGNTVPDYPGTPSPLAPACKEKFPELEEYVRIDPFMGKTKHLIARGDKMFYEERFILADPSLFEVFDFTLLKGDRRTLLDEPHDLVITQSIAEKYFGDEDPLGKKVLYDGKSDFVISGVMEDVPRNSHFRFNFVASYRFINEIKQWKNTNLLKSWGHSNFYTYVMLKDNTDPGEFEKKSTAFIREILERPDINIHLQPIGDIHLRSTNIRDLETRGSIMNVYLYSAVAVIILLIACINFMNLYTANSEVRAKEVGMRKVVGASRHQLIAQFLCEAIILIIIALPIALFLVELTMPVFNGIIGKQIDIDYTQNSGIVGMLILLTLIVGLISGSYPAFFISSFQPIKMLRGKLSSGKQGLTFRNILVVFQFGVSFLFIAGTLIINNQMRFIRNKDLGYDRSHIINIPLHSRSSLENYNIYRDEITRNNNIVDATATSFTPSIERWHQSEYFEGRQENDDHMFYRMACDFNYLDLFGMDIIAGRTFNRNIPTDLNNSWILNESAVRSIGWSNEEAVGKLFGKAPGRVVGVVKDFHFRSLRYETKPMAINVYPSAYRYISIKIQPGKIDHVVQFLEEKWKEINPGIPFEYYFYADEFNKLYMADIKLQTIFRYVTVFTIFIACLGLFGLSMFTVQRRTKEIGIRKVLGAKSQQNIVILAKDFFRLILISYILALPAAYLIVDRWLQNFSYRVSPGIEAFFLSGIVVSFVALVTISYHVVKVSRTNPIEVLKYE